MVVGDVKRFSCAELVDLATVYLEDALDEPARHQVERHLTVCGMCERYVGQLRVTVQTLGELPAERLAEPMRERLLAAFRESRRR
jgi:anti-sigma factor RsiW